MPVELNFEDITPGSPKAGGGVPMPTMSDGAPGGGVINWLSQLQSLMETVNQIIMNYKEIRNNMQPEEKQRAAQSPPMPYMNYIEPPTGRPAPLPVAPAAPDINAALLDKAREIIRTLYIMGFKEATIENVYDSFKEIKVSQLAGLLGVKDDTGLNK